MLTFSGASGAVDGGRSWDLSLQKERDAGRCAVGWPAMPSAQLSAATAQAPVGQLAERRLRPPSRQPGASPLREEFESLVQREEKVLLGSDQVAEEAIPAESSGEAMLVQ